MLGTIVNVAAIIAGTVIGIVIQTKLPKKVIEIIFQAMGLFTILLGVMMALKMQHFLIGIGSLVSAGKAEHQRVERHVFS